MVTHLHILFVASHNTTTVQSFNSSCPRTPTERDHIKSRNKDINDRLAAAAAVGNLTAACHYMTRGAKVSNWNTVMSKGFGTALEAAASTGKSDMLKLLLQQVRQYRHMTIDGT
jgi:hypothetical protein